MYKDKIKEKLNKIATNHIELNHRPALITMKKTNQSLLFRPQRKKLSLSKDLSSSSTQKHNQSTDAMIHEQDSISCKKHYMKVFSNSCSKELQKVQSTTLRLNHNPSTDFLSKRVNSQQIQLPQILSFFGSKRDNNQSHNKLSLPLSTTGSKQKIIPVLIQAESYNIKHSNRVIDADSKYTKHAQRTQSVYTIDTEIKKTNINVFQTPIRHFKTCYDEEQATFRKQELKTAPVKNNNVHQENTNLKKTSRFVCEDQLETSKCLQKVRIMPNAENLCKQNIFLEHSNRFLSPKYQNQHRIEHSPTPVIRGSNESSLQFKQINNRPLNFQQFKSGNAAAKHLPISKEIELVQEQRKQIESRISKKLDQLSERASQIARMCNVDEKERSIQQHRKPKILVSSSTKNIKHAAIMEPYHYSNQNTSASITNASSQFITRKGSRQVSSFLLNSANGSLRHQILNRIYS